MDLMNIRRNMMTNPLILESTSGNVLSFNTDISKLIKELKIDIKPVQNLNGYNHPWVGGCGVNQWNEEWEIGLLDTKTGLDDPWPRTIRTKGFVSVKPNTTYYAYSGDNDYDMWACFYDENQSVITSNLPSCNGSASNARNIKKCTFTTPFNCYWIRFYRPSAYGTTYNYDMSINYPATVTTYSPYSNVCSISGWTGIDIQQCKKNLANLFNDGYVPSTSNGELVSAYGYRSDYISIISNERYTFSISSEESRWVFMFYYDVNKNYISYASGNKVVSEVMPSNAKYIMLRVEDTNTITTPQLEKGTQTDYEQYQNTAISISWQSSANIVCYGNLNVTTGLLTVTHERVSLTGEEENKNWYDSNKQFSAKIPSQRTAYYDPYEATFISDKFKPCPNNYRNDWVGNYISLVSSGANYAISHSKWTSQSDATTWLANNPVTFIYKLATPIIYQLTPVQIQTLIGQNNIWTNLNENMEIKYWNH